MYKSLTNKICAAIVLASLALPLVLSCQSVPSPKPKEPVPSNPFTNDYKVDTSNSAFFTDSDSVALLTAATPFYISAQTLPSQKTGAYDRARASKIEEINRESQTLVNAVSKLKPKLETVRDAYAAYLETSLGAEPKLQEFAAAVVTEMQDATDGEAILEAQYNNLDSAGVEGAYAKSFIDYAKTVMAVQLGTLYLKDVENLANYAGVTLIGLNKHSSVVINRASEKFNKDMEALDSLKPDVLAIVASRQKIDYGLKQLDTASYYFALAANDFINASKRDLETAVDRLKPGDYLTRDDIKGIQEYLAIFEKQLDLVKQQTQNYDKSKLLTAEVYPYRPGVAYAADTPANFPKAVAALSDPAKADEAGNKKSAYFSKGWAAFYKDTYSVISREYEVRAAQQLLGVGIDLTKMVVDYVTTAATRRIHDIPESVINENKEFAKDWAAVQRNLATNMSGVKVLNEASNLTKALEDLPGKAATESLGKGWQATAIGEVSKTAIGIFTGLSSSAYILANQTSTQTDMALASVGVAVSLYGGSKTLMTAPFVTSTEEALKAWSLATAAKAMAAREARDAAQTKARMALSVGLKDWAEWYKAEFYAKDALAKRMALAAEKTNAALANVSRGKWADFANKLARTAKKARIDALYGNGLKASIGKDPLEFGFNLLTGWADDGLKKTLGLTPEPGATGSAQAPAPGPGSPAQPKPGPAVQPLGKPDLVVTAVTYSPNAPKAETKLSVTFVVTNNGTADSGNFTSRVSLAKTRYGTDISLGNVDIPSIKGGGRQAVNVTTNAIPKEAAGGSYWITVFADTLKRVNESNVDNNIGSAGPVQIGVGVPVYKAVVQLTINDKFTLNRPFERATAISKTVITLTSDEFRANVDGKSAYPSFNGNYQFNGSVEDYTDDYGKNNWVKDPRESGTISKNGPFPGYARIGIYTVGGKLAFRDLSYYSLGEWSITGKSYLSGPGGYATTEMLKDVFGGSTTGGLLKDRLANPAGDTIDIKGNNTKSLGSNGSHTYDYTGTLTLKIVKVE